MPVCSMRGSGGCLDGKAAHGLRQDELAVDPFGGEEADLPVRRVQFGQALEGASLAVGDPVVGEVAEQDRHVPGRQFRRVDARPVRAVEDGVRLACDHARLPDVVPVAVLDLAQRLDGGVVQDPDRAVAVHASQGVEHVHDLVEGEVRVRDLRGRAIGRLDLGEDALRLLLAVADEERLLLGGTDAPCELGGDVALEVEDGVVHQLLGHLDGCAELVRGERDLVEGLVGFRVQAVLLHPARRPVGCDDRDGVRPAVGLDDVGEGAEEVLVGQRLHELPLVLVRDEVAAVRVGPGLEDVLDVVPVALADAVPERGLVRLGRDARLVVRLVLCARFPGERRRGRLGEHLVDLLLTLQALDVVREVGDLLLHPVIGGGVLRGHVAAARGVGVEEVLRGVPRLGSFFHKVHDLGHFGFLHFVSVAEKRQALPEVGGLDGRFRIFLRGCAFRDESGEKRVGDGLP